MVAFVPFRVKERDENMETNGPITNQRNKTLTAIIKLINLFLFSSIFFMLSCSKATGYVNQFVIRDYHVYQFTGNVAQEIPLDTVTGWISLDDLNGQQFEELALYPSPSNGSLPFSDITVDFPNCPQINETITNYTNLTADSHDGQVYTSANFSLTGIPYDLSKSVSDAAMAGLSDAKIESTQAYKYDVQIKMNGILYELTCKLYTYEFSYKYTAGGLPMDCLRYVGHHEKNAA